jgi:hypothetical protein
LVVIFAAALQMHHFKIVGLENKNRIMHLNKPLNLKKNGRGGKDRPPGIILRRNQNMVPDEKLSKT